eukprot:Hpha_TRINITY_DN15298_c0_g1::TRINITY_DN15298_c0_g1_i8::g.68283::m.68283
MKSSRGLLVGVCLLGLGGVAVAQKTKCPANAVWNDCGTACPSVCGKPAAQLCTEQCVTGCQCGVGFQRRSDKELAKGVPSTAADDFCIADSLCLAPPEPVPEPAVPEPQCPTCATARCPADTRCAEEKVQCVMAPCCPSVRCVPTMPPAPETAVPEQQTFNCYTKEMWTTEKQDWCCKNKQLGCLVVDPVPDTPAPEFNCYTKEMWTKEKKDWCCQVKPLGCP